MMTPEEQAYVRKLEETIVKLEARIAELERRLNMNSSNSSKPPSTDKPNQKKRSLRKPSGKKPGGQSGHKRTTLKLPCAPSKIIPCNQKECAGCALAGQGQGKCLESRYEIDAEITVVVRKYSQMEYLCPKSNTCLRGNFPENITATKCYGPKIQVLAIGMNTYCAVSVNKIHEFFTSVLKLPVSTGFIHNGLIYQGQQNNPIEYSDKGKRKQNIARRLADRLNEYSEDFCRFFWDFRVPFDNNQAERDVRHAKVKIKVSGCFRSLEGAKEFAKINSVLSTARKHGIAVIDTIMATLAQASCILWALASE